MGYSPWGCKESDTTKQLIHGAAENCTVQPGQNTEREGDPRTWKRPALCLVCPHSFMSVPCQDQRPAQHMQGPQTMMRFIAHACLVSQIYAADALCDLENSSLLESVKWGSQY